MRKLYVLIFMVMGCSFTKPAFHSKMPEGSVYIDPYYSWENNCPVKSFPSYGNCNSPWRSITIRVINKKYRNVKVVVQCNYKDINDIFGTQTKTINKRNDATFLIKGLSKGSADVNKAGCYISKIL